MKHALIALTLFAALLGCRKTDSSAANKAAEEYATKVQGATGTTCTETDSDGDGYCGCTVFRGDKDPLSIECGCEAHCWLNCIRGCKTVSGNFKMLNPK